MKTFGDEAFHADVSSCVVGVDSGAFAGASSSGGWSFLDRWTCPDFGGLFDVRHELFAHVFEFIDKGGVAAIETVHTDPSIAQAHLAGVADHFQCLLPFRLIDAVLFGDFGLFASLLVVGP